MREIKFRIWMNGRYNEQDEWIHIDTKGNVCIPQCCNEDCGPEDNQSEYIIEQYTGLKDKNGKEIYEGDIVHVYKEGWDVFPNLECTGEVVYKEEFASFFVLEQGGELLSFIDAEDSENIEIIGNIHKNHELLEKI